MKKLQILGITLTFFLITQSNLFAQAKPTTPSKEPKRQLIQNLIRTATLLQVAASPQYTTETRLDMFHQAIYANKEFNTSYNNLKATLTADLKDKLDLISIFYGKVCTDGSFQYLTDMNVITGMAITDAAIESAIEKMIK